MKLVMSEAFYTFMHFTSLHYSALKKPRRDKKYRPYVLKS